ncbi:MULTISPECIES: VOC family protein [unclassified Streptomyces]|uniref:VOC family protein n=1 Tax=unclassified Streptomyces TaxID=2593676 RepID=UPI00203374F6|nr:VOC family protein [Streptomyces sp. RKAG290]MCM2410414.1 VOC family protein [Streptomyces sp. RKAG290]
MLTTRFVDGAPNWMDLGTPDLDGATAFYTALFGWEYEPGGPETGGYGMFTLDGRTVGGAMTVAEEQSKPSWSVYFQTADADATAQLVRESGGAAAFAPMDVLEFGRMGGFTDRAGAYFGVWQPKLIPGLGVVGDTGSLCWAELCTPDVPAAAAFYHAVFGWESAQVPYPDGGGSYTLIRTSGGGEEAGFGGLVPLEAVPVRAVVGPHWLPYIEVDDCDAAVAEAERLGGRLTREPLEVRGVGTFADVTDPYGAAFAVIKSAPTPAG